MNNLAIDELFRSTKIFEQLKKLPFGFIDIGSMGGIHPIVSNIASITHALCFEPGEEEYQNLAEMYAENNSFADVTIMPHALGASSTNSANLYLTRALTNTSLLRPSTSFIERYSADRFRVERVQEVSTTSLDEVIRTSSKLQTQVWDFIKIDTQGSEWDILSGAVNTLTGAVAIWCEVEFFPVYSNQKLFADIDLLLREHGFFVYALYPHYRSAKQINRTSGDTEERLMWADALFLKDPLDERNSSRLFTERQIHSLIMATILTKQYDYAKELCSKCDIAVDDRGRLCSMLDGLASERRSAFIIDAERHFDLERGAHNGTHYRRFIDKFASNASIDWL